MKTKSCLNSCAPPDHTGKFELKMTFIGLYDGVVYTYDKPFKTSYNVEVDQKGLFTSTKLIEDQKDSPLTGVWKKKYDKNFCFSGWEHYTVNSLDSAWTASVPTKVCNNKLMEYYFNSVEPGPIGGQDGWGEYPSLSYGTGRRID